jgi:hypothetical protein
MYPVRERTGKNEKTGKRTKKPMDADLPMTNQNAKGPPKKENLWITAFDRLLAACGGVCCFGTGEILLIHPADAKRA